MVDATKRCPTGIYGLDELLEGGFPRSRTVMVSGTCGTGKSTFGVQFLYNGIVQNNEPGILVTLEQDPLELKQDMSRYGFDLDKLEKEGKIAIISAGIEDKMAWEDLSVSIPEKAKEIGAKRLVIDSLTAIGFLLEEMGGKEDVRKIIMSLSNAAKRSGLTTMMITETPEGSEAISMHGVESHIADGVIHLTIHEAMDSRKIAVRKMRSTKHSLKPHDMEFSEKGVRILETEKAKSDKKVLF
ncbi:MAG: hypothetical protein L6243_04265 [Candidatus Altiarchaeales archaeon]|nr:ATPase [Candidatus Altiarchaeota archaeon]MCG2782784.1 hypothetical protein [Candidatus Altiarchaeales archaeon]MBU4266625.1 ATPase [Candidatus Altiarchaeota archaeon]MBU4341193.1 ATPase [Candidatus Altiarchaeota archaeon]MBU4406413.1 ATPase [Candidatus Altiarchaeota archaeon]